MTTQARVFNQKFFKVKKIALTVGDPSGIGPEIIRAWAFENTALADGVEIIGHKSFLQTLPENFSAQIINSADDFVLGAPSDSGAKLAFDALYAAAEGCKNGKYLAVVTAPVSKAQMCKLEKNFVGQTEFFEREWGGEAVMCFVGEKLIVALATWHIALSKVSETLSEKNIQAAVKCADILAKKIRKIAEPKIALCGLNPHAGEGGLLGSEEVETINPIAKELQKKYPHLSDALPPDTVFFRALKNEFDSLVALYHDQGLIPLKTLEFDKAVNVSMGLPFIRTSPDHGTAFSIAGKNLASHESLSKALSLAYILAQ